LGIISYFYILFSCSLPSLHLTLASCLLFTLAPLLPSLLLWTFSSLPAFSFEPSCGAAFILTSFHLYFMWCRFLFSHLHLCCSLVLLGFIWLHFWLLPCSFHVRGLNGWFDNPCLFSLQEVSNFVKFIKNS